MKKKPASKYAFFNTRVLLGLAFCLIGLFLALVAFALYPGGKAFARQNQLIVPLPAQPSVQVLEATLTQELPQVQPAAQPVSETDLQPNGTIDMAVLGL